MNNLHWQTSRIRVLLRKYYIAISDTQIGSFLDVFFLLSASILWELHENPKIELQKKNIEIFVWGTSFFLTARPSLYVIFAAFFVCSLSLPSQMTFLLNSLFKDTKYYYEMYSVWWYHEWMVENMKLSCNLILAGWHL